MRFPEELVNASEFEAAMEKAGRRPEMNMAKKLVESMTEKWNPGAFRDDYHEKLGKVIEAKIQYGEKHAPKKLMRHDPGKVINLVSVLQKSIANAQKNPARNKAKSQNKAA